MPISPEQVESYKQLAQAKSKVERFQPVKIKMMRNGSSDGGLDFSIIEDPACKPDFLVACLIYLADQQQYTIHIDGGHSGGISNGNLHEANLALARIFNAIAPRESLSLV